MTRDLHALQRYVDALATIASEMQELQRQPAEGTDETGAVRVRLDADGVPTEIAVEHDWQRLLDVELLGAAVVEAGTAAAHRRMEAWAAAVQEHGVEQELAELGDDPFAARPTAAAAASTSIEPVPPRAAALLVEEAITALEAAQTSPASPQPPTVTAYDGSGQVSVSLDDTGLVGCTVFGDWARRLDGAYLSASLQEALVRAQAQQHHVADSAAEGSAAGNTLDGLLGEAMAALRDPRRFMDG